MTYDDAALSKTFDDMNIKILKELVTNPYASSTDIASKFRVPLSTVQRRRARLEDTVLKKEYALDIRRLGWRVADLLIAVDKGNAEETAQKLLQTSKSNVIVASLRIGHPQIDVMAEVFYRDSQELHRLTETVKGMPHVTYVEWAEVVKVVGSNLESMLDKVLVGRSD
ncbi:Lrp/AsnC family transcriptional regulator [Candidatus Nitrososphaera sp. FF02]|uniref:Lrp/AsnC family transcriptional regulator n=1 Tax=Candidatus Nitrososphaera sp. FF02 TaxID=3398226 RepID=UPI0039EAAF2E